MTPPPGLERGAAAPRARVAGALLLERLAPTTPNLALRERRRRPPARVLPHHHDVLVHQTLRDVGLGHLEVERRRAGGGAVEAHLLGHPPRGRRRHERARRRRGDCAKRGEEGTTGRRFGQRGERGRGSGSTRGGAVRGEKERGPCSSAWIRGAETDAGSDARWTRRRSRGTRRLRPRGIGPGREDATKRAECRREARRGDGWCASRGATRRASRRLPRP